MKRARATVGVPRQLAGFRQTKPGMARATSAIYVLLLAAGLATQPVAAADGIASASLAAAEAPSAEAQRLTRADFHRERASREARHIADWVVHSQDNHAGDHHGLPFVIVDKKDARVYVFDAQGHLRGAAAALLGQARGDDAAPGIGDKELSKIRPEEKTTPAGRFLSSLGGNMRGEDVLWVDYATATSMHRVLTTNPKEHRAQRLASPTTLDNRISYGCINIPVKFYENVVRPAFTGTQGIVYVLPETKTARQVFASYDVEGPAEAEEAVEKPAKVATAKTKIRTPDGKSQELLVNAVTKKVVR
jgi:hypothetical protein